MAALSIFVSFEFDKDKELQNNFYQQAKEETNHRIRDCSLHESYPDEAWENKAWNAICPCDVVIVLVGQDTHNAPGVIKETNIARNLGKPIIQVRPKRRPYQGLTHLGKPIRGTWKNINAELDKIANPRG